MSHFFSRFSAAGLAFILTFSSLQFSAENLFDADIVYAVDARGEEVEEDVEEPTETPPASTTESGADTNADEGITTDSTLGKAQAALTAQEMRGYQSLYEMQAELFAECVAKLRNWSGTGGTLDEICEEEKEQMNEQGVNRLLVPDATREQVDQEELKGLWWDLVLEYWFSFYEDEALVGGLLPPLNKFYVQGLTTSRAPAADPKKRGTKKSLRKLVWTREWSWWE